MRILFCTHVYPPDSGGVASFTQDLAALLQNGGNEVKVLHELGGGEGLCRPVAAVMYRFRRSRLGIPLRFFHFLCAAITFRPDVVLCSNWLNYGLPAVQFVRFFGYKVVIQVHGTEIRGRFKLGHRRQRLERVLNAADLLWPNSHFTSDLLLEYGCSQAQMQIVHPFLPDELLQAARSGQDTLRSYPPLILTAGHLYPRKGIDLVLQALSHLQDLGWQYVVAGEEPHPGYRRSYETMAEELGIASRVRFLGRVPRSDLWELMARSSIFVMTSRPNPDDIESFGIVYIEAQAFGVACVAARVGGVSDAVGDGGILIPPENTEALAGVLREWLDHPRLALLLGERGRSRVFTSFTKQARRAEIMPRLEALFRE